LVQQYGIDLVASDPASQATDLIEKMRVIVGEFTLCIGQCGAIEDQVGRSGAAA
jgi:hypothetical protein